jgi:hypothetical protein
MAKKWEKLKGKLPDAPLGNMSNATDVSFLAKVDMAKSDYSKLSYPELQAEFEKLDKEKDALSEQEKILNVNVEAVGRLLLARFEEQEIGSLHTKSGYTIYTNVEPYIQVDNRATFEEHVMSQPDLDYLWSVNHQTLSSLVKDFLERGLDTQIPPGLKVFLKTAVRIKKT